MPTPNQNNNHNPGTIPGLNHNSYTNYIPLTSPDPNYNNYQNPNL